ncbi:uncharacterized protein LOC120438905 [Tachysurus ichikawai]
MQIKERFIQVCQVKSTTGQNLEEVETAVASAAIQHKDVDLAVSYTSVEGVLKRLQELRTESEFKVVFEKAKERAEAAGIEFPDKIPGVESGDAELVRTVSKFYGIEEEKVFTELKVFHASYSFTKIERSFSKLKLVKSSLQSLCNEERLSDLLLLSIERDIPINRDEVIRIFKKTADRRILI